MEARLKPRQALTALLLASLLATLWAPFPALAQEGANKPLTVYTAMTATTAQLPLLGAIKKGWPEGSQLKVEYWKNLEDLRALVLAGKGEVWVGHLETLSRAAARGAPVSLVAVTVWRKFFFVSAPLPIGPGGAQAHPANVGDLLAAAAKNNLAVTMSPQNSPQANLLNELKDIHGQFPVDSLPPQQLALELIRGQRLIALMPEPMASAASLKDPNLKIIGSLEEEYSKNFGGDGFLPQAGVAVNLSLATGSPETVASLIRLMTATVEELRGKPVADKIALFPPDAQEALGLPVLEATLGLEPLIIKSAAEAKGEVEDFLLLVTPELFEKDSSLPPSFFWDPAVFLPQAPESPGSPGPGQPGPSPDAQ
ncbi:MAG: hypothetical protein LBU69_01055 [Deltaproteobacteria bacterium]|jgi:NitT/TauT family transport system substrate-binding protein|nr:hypothetical protein [Deltaproteobacteria bacterium]